MRWQSGNKKMAGLVLLAQAPKFSIDFWKTKLNFTFPPTVFIIVRSFLNFQVPFSIISTHGQHECRSNEMIHQTMH